MPRIGRINAGLKRRLAPDSKQEKRRFVVDEEDKARRNVYG